MCDTFIRRPFEFLCGGEAITKRKESQLLTLCVQCRTCYVSVDLYFIGRYVRRLSNVRTYQYWINLITVIIQHTASTQISRLHTVIPELFYSSKTCLLQVFMSSALRLLTICLCMDNHKNSSAVPFFRHEVYRIKMDTGKK